MGIFNSILTQMQNAQAQAAQSAQTQSAAQQVGGFLAGGQGGAIDVEAVLERKMAEKGNPNLNWRTSIADLMRLLDLDPSLDNRKELATELGYEGEKNGSAEMNIWLHKKVMQGLAENGGRVPAGMAD